MDSPEMEEIVEECNFIIIVYVLTLTKSIKHQPPNREVQCQRHFITQEGDCEFSSLGVIPTLRRDLNAGWLTRVQATDCVVNLVPVLYKTGLKLDQVIPRLIFEMNASRDRLDSAAARLHAMTLADSQLNHDVMEFIDGIRIMDTGTLEYS